MLGSGDYIEYHKKFQNLQFLYIEEIYICQASLFLLEALFAIGPLRMIS